MPKSFHMVLAVIGEKYLYILQIGATKGSLTEEQVSVPYRTLFEKAKH